MSNPLHSKKGRVLPLQEYPGRGTHWGEEQSWGFQGTHLALWLFLCMRNVLSWDCVRKGREIREMRSQGGTQTSWGKTPMLDLTNPTYVILIHSLNPVA